MVTARATKAPCYNRVRDHIRRPHESVMSQLVDFYRGQAPDSEGRRVDEIQSWSDEDLEIMHDFIQWLFPLPEPSQYNPEAPILTQTDISIFRSDVSIRANLRRSFERILTFLGLTITPTGAVIQGPNFFERVPEVWAAPNHNWLRITRILKSLSLLGLEQEAGALYRWLDAACSSRRFPITAETFRFWSEAAKSTHYDGGR